MMKTNRLPDTELANTIRKLQNEVDEKILILNALREQYSGNETIEWGEYIHSVAWEETRQKIFRRDGFRCVCCGASKNLNVHHITYDNLGAEKPSDLVTLCQKCHEKVHNGEELPKKSGSTVRLGVPEGFTLKEWQLLLCIFALGEYEYYRSIEEEFQIKPDYFQSFRAKKYVQSLACGCGFDTSEENLLSKLTEDYKPPIPKEVAIDLYYSTLFSVWLIYFEYQGLLAITTPDEEKETKLKDLVSFKNRLREKVGDL